MNRTRLTAILGVGVLAAPLVAREIPSRPEQIEFGPLNFEPPRAAELRRELPGGIPVYLAESHEFPLVTITLSFKGGASLEPVDKAGLAPMTGAMIQQGGTTSRSPSELEEDLDFLAADVRVNVGDDFSSASINCLTSNLDEAFALFMQMVREPGFDAARTEVVRGQNLERLKQRDDQGFGIAMRELGFLLWGEDHFEGRQPTGDSLASITREDMRALHHRIFHPGNMIVSVTGDFEASEMLAFLDDAFAGWKRGDPVPDPEAPTHVLKPGLYHYEKDQPQSQVLFAQRAIERDDPDAIPVEVMNDILGGSGFTSRIMNRVRTKEGLAYSAGSFVQPRVGYPGAFGAYFMSKNATAALGAKVTLDEIDRIRTEEVTTDELDTAVRSIIETFPRRFESKDRTLRTFVNDEWTGRDPTYWSTYRDRVREVTPDEVLRVAHEHLDPSKMGVLIVGPWDQIAPGNTDSEDDPSRVTTIEDVFPNVTHIPVRDPVTLKPKE